MPTDDQAMAEIRQRMHPWQSIRPFNPEAGCICPRCSLILPPFFMGFLPGCVGGPLPHVQDQ